MREESSPIIRCDVCYGRGRLPNRKKCFACLGSGKLFRPQPGDRMPEPPPTELDEVVYVLASACSNGCEWAPPPPERSGPHKASLFNHVIYCSKCKWGEMSFDLSPEQPR